MKIPQCIRLRLICPVQVLFLLISTGAMGKSNMPVLKANTVQNAAGVELLVFTGGLESDPFSLSRAVISLHTALMKTGLAENVKISGCPMYMSVPQFDFDSFKVAAFAMSWQHLKEQMNQMKWDTIKLFEPEPSEIKWKRNEDRFFNRRLRALSGGSIFLRSMAVMRMMKMPANTDIYLPDPAVFFYKDKQAVKFKIFCRAENQKALEQFLKDNILQVLNAPFEKRDVRTYYDFRYMIIPVIH